MAVIDAFDRLGFNENLQDHLKDIRKFFKSRPSRKLWLNSFRNGNRHSSRRSEQNCASGKVRGSGKGFGQKSSERF